MPRQGRKMGRKRGSGRDDFGMGHGIGVDYSPTSGLVNDVVCGNYRGATLALRFDIGFAL